MKSNSSYDDLIIECIDELKINKQKQKKLINEKRFAEIDANKITARKYLELERNICMLQVKHFERFIELIVQIRNIGNTKKGGYTKSSFISEFQTYIDAKKRSTVK